MKIEYYWSKIFKKLHRRAIKNSIIHKTSKIEAGSHIVNSTFGKHSFCGYDCEIVSADIGSFCSIANNVKIGGGMHPIEWVSTSPVFYMGRDSVKAKFSVHKRKPIEKTTIGNDVWIGEGAIIKQGIKIENGAVIGMGSIVTKDVTAYSIVAGNPAKPIKNRFDDITIQKLLDVKWWDFDELTLEMYAKYFTNPVTFIKEFENKKKQINEKL
jgi:acetyltransferase-like isoleucine patch superfamily enzyme